ncbi:hypothetical protein [Raineyella fluvialis]|uniref:Uncharacterized protein n=1 Tax=Raineyella fluvialis TaxID=2662261 RepID=A0A5Q2F8Y4_9ACTN|nr:hypothetical protein [Raineyella fluvialis]QGF23138.1 hypothetical protein Rai3103_05070 [Raineyella fluvialis]
MTTEIESRQDSAAPEDALLLNRARNYLATAAGLAEDGLNPLEWWTGSQIEAAWSQLRLAEENLVRASSHDAGVLRADALTELAHAVSVGVAATDPRLAALREALAAPAPDLTQLRELTVRVTVAAHLLSDQMHQAQRGFRNQLRGITILLIVLAVVTVAGVSAVPGAEALIPRPDGLAMLPALLLAFGMGGIGALFSAVPSLSQMPQQISPFNTAREQATLKVITGAWSAVVGLVVVAAGISGGITGDPMTVPGFAIVSALFGAQQEALTRFADHKAATMTPGA